ncbi:hypothetical protein RD792_011457 [Penstemon davidsonii]|uniref:Uncharacterized protein n=1 Tax=Penstemon davidsonii TaxID=160366 RepID=A0ABR0D4N3_9LAMI|nr:hypothetical protein RD792_011457 [Penstemon davidsonii]
MELIPFRSPTIGDDQAGLARGSGAPGLALSIGDGLRNPKSSLSQINSSNMELFNNLTSMDDFNGIMQLSQLPISFNDAIPRSIGSSSAPIYDPFAHFFPSTHGSCNETNNKIIEPEIMGNSSPSASGNGFIAPHKNYVGKKRKRNSEREKLEKPREVVHVRAKRGQATDSHSLAERTMGMAVMLDVIINYVRSLQNQIDFLSMKLSAASLFYDFNSSEAEAMEKLQGTSGYVEAATGMEKLVEQDGYGGGISHFQTSNWPL